jgi:hypothetical protein
MLAERRLARDRAVGSIKLSHPPPRPPGGTRNRPPHIVGRKRGGVQFQRDTRHSDSAIRVAIGTSALKTGDCRLRPGASGWRPRFRVAWAEKPRSATKCPDPINSEINSNIDRLEPAPAGHPHGCCGRNSGRRRQLSCAFWPHVWCVASNTIAAWRMSRISY